MDEPRSVAVEVNERLASVMKLTEVAVTDTLDLAQELLYINEEAQALLQKASEGALLEKQKELFQSLARKQKRVTTLLNKLILVQSFQDNVGQITQQAMELNASGYPSANIMAKGIVVPDKLEAQEDVDGLLNQHKQQP